MNFGTYNKKNHQYEMVNATRSDFTFELMVAEQDDLILIPEIKFRIAKSPKTGKIVSIFELISNFTCQCMHGLART